MAVFAAADAPLRARQVCEAMDLEITPNTSNNTRLKLKRLVERGILVTPPDGTTESNHPRSPSGPDCSQLAETATAHEARILAFPQDPALMIKRNLQLCRGWIAARTPTTVPTWTDGIRIHHGRLASGSGSGSGCGSGSGFR
ncbi:hypothetical protein [Streptomyces mirabilis]